MNHEGLAPLISTIRERCRVCYTCVRECPAKAIRIHEGQAEVVPERCVGCGNCVRVCSQEAKEVRSSEDEVWSLLNGSTPVAACLAPSFPAEFLETSYQQVVGMLRAMGFTYVHEVAFGADLVAREYNRLLMRSQENRFIATTCPAIVAYVEKYFPSLVPFLAPVVSPMVAEARVIRQLYDRVSIVFIGPCIAKKGEALDDAMESGVDAVLTFAELRHMLREARIRTTAVEPSEFDQPYGGKGALFSISRGILQAAGMTEDLSADDVVSADGRETFVEAIQEFKSGDLQARLLEVLACRGCILGPAVSNRASLFRRRRCVSAYVRDRLKALHAADWGMYMNRFDKLDLARQFKCNDQRIKAPSHYEIAQIMRRMGKYGSDDELNCGACGYASCRDHATAIYKGLAESEMCLPYTIDQLEQTVRDLAVSNKSLAETREALMHSEKLATMGQLAAGIAHELNNPLGVVLMYSHLMKKAQEENPALQEDLEVVVTEADRCKKIVSGLLHFARENKVTLEPVNLQEIVDRSIELCQFPDTITVETDFQTEHTTVDLDSAQILQVFTNLIDNAIAAMPQGGTLKISVADAGEQVEITIADTGTGITKENRGKIFEPFFTTKPIGEGTGLGLAISYGIIKMHRGDINVQSNTDPDAGPLGTTFTLVLPRTGMLARESSDDVPELIGG